MFNSSIRQNITFKADDEQIDFIKFNKAIELSGLSELLNSNVEKEFFQIGEFGKKISGGQKQRIGIARALYKNSSLLIFDESTNALDENNEKIIIENILILKNKTVIFITHNLNNLRKFDKILELKNSKIIEKNIKN